MKKIAVILCLLLSLFVFVSCPTPDDPVRKIEIRVKDPACTELAGYSLLWNGEDTSDDLIRISGTGNTLLYSFIYDGTDDFTYTLLPYSEGASLPGDVQGEVHLEDGIDVYYLTPPSIEMQNIVIKIRNSDFAPDATRFSLVVVSEYYKDFRFEGEFDKADGEFTEIPMPEDFLGRFTTGAGFEFTVDSLIPDVVSLGDELNIMIRYKPGNDVYILEKPRPLAFKVLNSDLPVGAARFEVCFEYEGNVHYNLPVDVDSSNEYTVLPNTVILSDRFREFGVFEVKVTVDDASFFAKLSYSSETVDYIISNTGYIPPSERGKSTVSIKPGTYMEKVSYYGFQYKPESASSTYVKVPAAESGNTVLVVNKAIEAGSEYTVTALYDGNGGPYPLGERKGTIVLPADGNEIVFEPMTPYGRIKLEFDAPFWHFSNSYSIDGVRRTRRWDKICPEYVYLPEGEHSLSDVSCTGVGNQQSTKIINLDLVETFSIESSRELVKQVTIGDRGDTFGLEFHLRGGIDYKVTLRFKPNTEGFDSFYYIVEGREDFTLPNIPSSTYEIFIEARTGSDTKGKTVKSEDFIHSRMIAYDFIEGSYFIPE